MCTQSVFRINEFEIMWSLLSYLSDGVAMAYTQVMSFETLFWMQTHFTSTPLFSIIFRHRKVYIRRATLCFNYMLSIRPYDMCLCVYVIEIISHMCSVCVIIIL